MKLVVKKDYAESSRYLADMFRDTVLEKPDALLGLATGSSPIGLYDCMTEDYEKGIVDFSRVHTINLDEYEGLPRSNDQSFGYFMDKHLFSRVNIAPENIMLIDGTDDPQRQADIYNRYLDSHRIDMLVVGIGTNGHIGFNEPEPYFESSTHVTDLTEATIKANSRFFASEDEVPNRAITMGVKGIVCAKRVALIATGEFKAAAIKQLLSDDRIDPMLPCSIMKLCADATVIIDEALYNKIR